MNANAIRAMLQSTLDDYSLSRAEKSKVREELQGLSANPQAAAEFRRLAFEVARSAATSDTFAAVLTWLEDIVRVLQPETARQKTEIVRACFSPHDNCPGEIRSLIATCRSSLDLCVFTITDDRLTDAVLDAHHRGVKIRIITDNDKAADLGSDADRFSNAGIPLRIDRTSFHMHHKFAIFDASLLLNGSYNWTRSAAEHNEENFIITDQPVLISVFQQQFEKLWSSLV